MSFRGRGGGRSDRGGRGGGGGRGRGRSSYDEGPPESICGKKKFLSPFFEFLLFSNLFFRGWCVYSRC